MKKILSVMIIITMLTGMLFVLSGCESSESSNNVTTSTSNENATNNNNLFFI